MDNDREHPTPTTTLPEDMAATRLGYRSADHFLTFAQEKVGTSSVADRWIRTDYQEIFEPMLHVTEAFMMVKRLMLHHYKTTHHLEALAAASRNLTFEQRAALADNYPELMEALLAVEDGYREGAE